MTRYILSIDQGTTSTRAIVFDQTGQLVSVGQREFSQYFPNDGWVEHDPEEIWQTTLTVCREAMAKASIEAQHIAAIGITNQRETTVVWDRATGEPIHRAIVWQDRRTASDCERLKAEGFEATVQAKTGLLLDAYFSGTKISWILDHVDGARQRADAGELAFGTIDTFLLWRLTGGKSHKTDATNASRTLLYNLHTGEWDAELLDRLHVPASLLPTVEDSSADFGHTDTALFGAAIPITGIAGDQQAALIGQACFEPGMVKSTYGTGCFLMLNTGSKALQSHNRLLTTVAYQLNGVTTYAMEGSIFVAGAAVKWCRDGAQLIQHASETEAMAEAVGVDNAVYMVPAFTGLGAPYWDANARGAILGLTLDSNQQSIVTAAVQAVGYQTVDLLKAMQSDGAQWPATVRVDGGMVVNDWMVQFLSDIAEVTVDRPTITETTALGVAYLAGLQVGLFDSLEQIQTLWQCERRFEASMPNAQRQRLYSGWLDALNRVRTL